ncbi:TPA: glycosyltransferase [Mannheimia haemolytica]|nr:glycosyltransferase [Mannheimia haemolytica]HDL5444329.1 glycosyltransferase [Mannheimia haemolytica]
MASVKKRRRQTGESNFKMEEQKLTVLMEQLQALRINQTQFETKILRLEQQNAILKAEKNALTDNVKEYEQLYKNWEIELNNLLLSEQKARQKLDNVKHTVSFRLGYAMVFGFKSWGGFKSLLKTLKELYDEKRSDRRTRNIVSPQQLTLQKPEKHLDWQNQKPVLQWNKSLDQEYLTKWFSLPIMPDLSNDSEILFEQSIPAISIDCTGATQLTVALDLFSKDGNFAAKQALLTVAFCDADGNVLKPIVDMPFSAKLECHYFYLNINPQQTDYITLILPQNTSQVKVGVEAWDKKGALYLKNYIKTSTLYDGVSVILPTYKGEKTIIKCLESLATQTLDFSLFEVLVVINGEQDSSKALIEQFCLKNPHLNIQVFELDEGNVSKARNFAVSRAQKAWVTFIDDDDWVDNNYLSSLYLNGMYNRITITGIEDIKNDEVVRSNIMNQLDAASRKEQLDYNDVTSILTMNACKLAPTYMVKNTRYNSSLKSGEDVLYWSELLNLFQPKVALVKDYETANYKRLIRDNSISRKAESYDFNVRQRLEVIQGLEKQLALSPNPKLSAFIQSKINAQAGFAKRYLSKFPAEYAHFITDVQDLNLHNRFVGDINHQFTNTLVISYCYAPYIDTSGVVMSKRVRAMNKPVDLISNSMSKVRETDNELLKISNLYLGKHIELNASQSFANWKAIKQFSDLALDSVHQLVKSRKVYDELYSRAMWPASHIAAAVIKMKYPQMKWVAEFSDPILIDVSGKERFEEIGTDWLWQQGFISHLDDNTNKNLFYWCEQLPYLYADELIFTNQNQLNYMLSYANSAQADLILSKAKIIPQPTLDRSFYEMSSAKLERDTDSIYLGYFGSFYVNRGFKPFIDAWAGLPESVKYKLKLYIYTQQDADSVLQAVPEDLKAQIVLQKYVGYFDFLALSDQFDGLVVMDAQTKGLKMNNPYLPSKISDYLGSKATTLALVEKGSPMSDIEDSRLIKVDMFDATSIQKILADWLMVISPNDFSGEHK